MISSEWLETRIPCSKKVTRQSVRLSQRGYRMSCVFSRLAVVAIAFFNSQFAHASERYWGEFGLDLGGGAHVEFKHVDGNQGWAVGLLRAEQDFLLLSNLDRQTMEQADASVHIFSIVRTWSRSNSWGNLDAGVGLGFASGNWVDNCEPLLNNRSYSELCDVVDVGDIGLPLKLSASVGKYLGFGVSVNVLVTESRTFRGLSFFVPFGYFPK